MSSSLLPPFLSPLGGRGEGAGEEEKFSNPRTNDFPMAGPCLLWEPTFYSVSALSLTFRSCLSCRHSLLLFGFFSFRLLQDLESLEEDDAHQESGKGSNARVARDSRGVILTMAGGRDGGNTGKSELGAKGRDGFVDGALDFAANGGQGRAVSGGNGEEITKVRQDLALDFLGAFAEDGADKVTDADSLGQGNENKESDEETHLRV